MRYLVVKGTHVIEWGNMPLAPDLVKDGLIADPVRVSSAIDALFVERSMARSSVIASMSGLRSVPRIFGLPKARSFSVNEAIQNEAEREMPVSLKELYLFWQPLAANGSESQYYVVGVPRNLLDAELQALGQAGISPYEMDLKPLALARAVNREEALILDLEPESFDLVVIAEGVPVVTRTIISRGPGMTQEYRAQQLASEVARTLEFCHSSPWGHSISSQTPVILTGLLANDAPLYELLHVETDDPISVLETPFRDLVETKIENPIEPLSVPFECPPELPIAEYAVNIGLVLKEVAPKKVGRQRVTRIHTVDMNFLPREQASSSLGKTVRVLSNPILALLLLALVVPMYLITSDSGSEVSSRRSQLDSLTLDLGQREGLLTAISAVETEEDSLRAEREAVLGVGTFAESLKVVLGAVPLGVQLLSLMESEGEITLDGRATAVGDMGGRDVVIAFVDALEETSGITQAYVSSLTGGEGSDPAVFRMVCTLEEAATTS